MRATPARAAEAAARPGDVGAARSRACFGGRPRGRTIDIVRGMVVVFVLVAAGACSAGGSTSSPPPSPVVDAGPPTPTASAEPFACGSMMCAPQQRCFTPCCSNGPGYVACAPVAERDDAGAAVCPSGMHWGGSCGGEDNFVGDCLADEPPCTPPQPFCVDDHDGGPDCPPFGLRLQCYCP